MLFGYERPGHVAHQDNSAWEGICLPGLYTNHLLLTEKPLAGWNGRPCLLQKVNSLRILAVHCCSELLQHLMEQRSLQW